MGVSLLRGASVHDRGTRYRANGARFMKGEEMNRDRFAAAAAASGAAVGVTCPRCGAALRLVLHYDAKTSPAVVMGSDSQRRARAAVPNALPLPAGPLDVGGSCPGVTAACVNCYAAGLESWAPGFRRAAAANLETLRHLHDHGGRSAVVRALVALVEHSAAVQRAAGVRRPSFRWHSDGDLFASWYAVAVRKACEQTPEVDHWLYTRSLSLVRYLMPRLANLAVYVSADAHNVAAAARVAGRYGLPVAMLADDERDAAGLWARAHAVGALPAPVLCPASGTGKYGRDGLPFPAHVTGPDGKRSTLRPGGAAVGACIACGVCLPGGAARSVTFTVHGGKAAPDSPGRLGAAVRVRVLARSGDRD